jgi:hypothetical protein
VNDLTIFGTYTLPHVLGVNRQYPRVQQQMPLPGRSWSYRKDRGGYGAKFTVRGEIRPTSQQDRDDIAALADGVARILDVQETVYTTLEKCFRYETGPTWIDNTVEARTAAGTPFNLLDAATDYVYFGHRERYNTLIFDLQTLGNYGARTWEYSDGAGAWKTLTIATDGTAGFTQDGTVLFTSPSDWKQDTVNAITGKFWVRVKIASKTTAATVNRIQINNVFNCLMLDPTFDDSIQVKNRTPYSLLFLQQENP